MRDEEVKRLDEWAMAFRVAGRVSQCATGWVRAVRGAVGLTAVETAARIGVVKSELFRMEKAEVSGAIELRTLRRMAEGLGCDLIYGLAPKQGSFADWVVEREAARVARRQATRRAWLDKAKAKRLEARKARWEREDAGHPERRSKEWCKLWLRPLPREVRRMVPERIRKTPFWKEQMRRALRRALREQGIRLK